MKKGQKIHKFIDLSGLPRIKGTRYNKNKIIIDWKNSIGYKVYFEYDDIKDYMEIIDYIKCDNKKYKLKIKYKDNKDTINTGDFANCSLGKILNKITKDFKINIGTNFKDEKRDLTIIDREYKKEKVKDNKYNTYNTLNEKWYKYHCNKCNAELFAKERDLLKGQGCSCCVGKTVVNGINDIATIYPHLVKYFVNIEDAYVHTFGSGDKILMKCPNCGSKKYMTINDLKTNGFSCSKCSDGISYPNKFMFNLLQHLNIDFKTEYSPNWIKPKRYDFYIPSLKLIIEMDGQFHNKDNIMNGRTYKESKEIDNYKDKLAKEHNLKVIRIDCDYPCVSKRFEYIKNNVINELYNIFDLSNIDWNKINLQSNTNSLLLKVCKLKHDNPNLTSSQISELLKPQNSCNRATIIQWLKLGNELGLCIYNKNKERNAKCVEIFNNNGISLGIFRSCMSLSKNSEKLFGINLNYKCISKAFLNNKPYKGFTFKYITLEEYERRISEDPTLKESEQAS